MVKTIYHGSEKIIEKPRFGFGKRYNDYGLGFYCTESLEMAMEWGVNLGKSGYANRYTIDCDGLKLLNLSSEHFCILHWLTVLLENREFDVPSLLALESKTYLLENFHIDYEQYDVIVGYRADDSYFSFAQDFLNGTISYRQLGNAMRLGKLGQQFVIKSEEAFARIQFQGYEFADHTLWYEKKSRCDQSARRDYFSLERNRRQRGDLYMPQILDEEIRADDPRLR